MMQTRSFALVLVPALALVPALSLLGCAEDSTRNVPGVSVVEEGIPANGAHFVGTYANETHKAGDLSLIVLKKDSSFHAETYVDCIKAPCDAISQDGYYSLFRQDTTTYIELFDQGTRILADKYQYVLMGDFLNLRHLTAQSDGQWISMARSPAAWCMTNNDCREQDLLTGPCAGQYICQTGNFCNYHCGNPAEMSAQ